MENNNYDSYFSMSVAYLEIGKVAASHANVTSAYKNAVAYQLYHAIELFIKYAILKNNNNAPKTHDLSILFEEYNSLYPDEIYRIDHPFDFEPEPNEFNIGEQEAYEKHIEKYKPKYMDQHLRYPPDSRTGGYSYSIDSGFFNAMQEKFLFLHDKINC